MATKTKKRGVTGRKWKRHNRRVLSIGDVDGQGMLTVRNPDMGTRNGHRYALVHCGCGCNVNVEVRIDNFIAGTASCLTRKRKHDRGFMQKHDHIKKAQLIGKVLDGVKLPETAVAAAREYAQRLANDAQLQAEVRQWNKASLAERDIKRAKQLAGVSTATPTPAVIVPAPTPLQTLIQQLKAEMPAVYERLHDFKQLSVDNIKRALSGDLTPRVAYSPREGPPIVSPLVALVAPAPRKTEVIAVGETPYTATEECHYATQDYFNTFKKMPDDDFDLRAWYQEHLKPKAKQTTRQEHSPMPTAV
jgi:hypothetical protein